MDALVYWPRFTDQGAVTGARGAATVLAADVAGYSRLMGRDEERTLANLKALRKTLVDPAIGRGPSVILINGLLRCAIYSLRSAAGSLKASTRSI